MLLAFVFLVHASVRAAPPLERCGPPALLPAYAHNDYRNQRPLLDAIELGFRGVEADLFRVGTELLVGHGRGELRPSRTLAQLYLEPLQRRKRSCGHVLPDSTPFLLNIELKDADSVAFRLLASELLVYEELFQAATPTSPPAVQVTLVGWWPKSDSTASWPLFLKVHAPLDRDAGRGEPALRSRVALVSIDYGKAIRWPGQGPIPRGVRELLARARQHAASYGAPIRVHHVPQQQRIYAWLLSEGVTLIGAEDLRRTRALLEGI